MTSASILVTDGDQRSALAVVRSLGRAGHRVHVCASRARSLAGGSRWAASESVVADPLRSPELFARDVRGVADARGIEVLLPITDASLFAVLEARESLSGVRIPFPPLDTVRRVADKSTVLEAAPRFGIAVPAQRTVSDRAALEALDPLTLPTPAVLKPWRSVTEEQGCREKLGVQHAATREDVVSRLRAMRDAAFPVLVQQRIVGPGTGIFLLLWEGKCLAQFAHRRLREKPPSGGVSVYCESIVADPALVASARALLQHFGWCGVAMVEFKRDAMTGTPYLMEINGRFWGSLQLAIDAGVDFPRLLVAAALGETEAPVASYRVGARSRSWWGDIDHLLARLRYSRAELALPPDAPSRWQAVREFCTVRARDRSDVFRWDDPRPFVREAMRWLRGA